MSSGQRCFHELVLESVGDVGAELALGFFESVFPEVVSFSGRPMQVGGAEVDALDLAEAVDVRPGVTLDEREELVVDDQWFTRRGHAASESRAGGWVRKAGARI
jgi:hypothetical protein